MKYIAIRAQLVFVSILLLLIFGMMMVITFRYNQRWDFTQEKAYSLSEATASILKEMMPEPLEVIAFYPHDDLSRNHLEVFLKQAQMTHSNLRYSFFDPDRVPSKAKEYDIKELYTVILQYRSRREKILQPTEQTFTNALFKLINPKKMDICFVTGHGEAAIERQDRNGYWFFQEALRAHNYNIHELILARDKVPDQCHVVVVGGPHRDFDPQEFEALEAGFIRGAGIFFLIDPMDPGTGNIFKTFLKKFGVELGENVIVDKVSRMVGGDFLVPLVGQYVSNHPITEDFNRPTFFPVARSVQPSVDLPASLDAVPLAVTGSGSWAETNLAELEKGEAVFESETDLLGPISIAVAVDTGTPIKSPQSTDRSPQKKEAEMKAKMDKKDEKSVDRGLLTADSKQAKGRLVVVGDSDFLTNAYLDLSANVDFALNMIQWLSRDDRFIKVRPRTETFKPHLLNAKQRFVLISGLMVAIPLIILVLGSLGIFWRKRTA